MPRAVRRTQPRRIASAAVGALFAFVSGCANGPAPPATWDWHLTATADEVGGFRDTRSLLDGFDAARPGERVGVGDRALFGVRLLDGAERREWFVRVTARLDEPDPAAAASETERRRIEDGLVSTRVRIEVFDVELTQLGDDEVALLGAFFGGALRGCRHPRAAGADAAPLWGPGPYTPASAATRSLWAVGNVVRIVESTDSLMSILREVARLPPLWTLLRGVRVSFGMEFDRAVPVTEGEAGSAFAFPLRIMINSCPALLCTVTAEEPVSPIRVCGGFTRLVACDPEDMSRRVVLVLLAARRADRPAVVPRP